MCWLLNQSKHEISSPSLVFPSLVHILMSKEIFVFVLLCQSGYVFVTRVFVEKWYWISNVFCRPILLLRMQWNLCVKDPGDCSTRASQPTVRWDPRWRRPIPRVIWIRTCNIIWTPERNLVIWTMSTDVSVLLHPLQHRHHLFWPIGGHSPYHPIRQVPVLR